MGKVLKSIFIGMLALGLMGIILGISLGLYRNDVLARMQAAEDSSNISEEPSGMEQDQDGDIGSAESSNQHNTLMELLLWGNLHTKFLGIGTLLTITSATIFLISIRRMINR